MCESVCLCVPLRPDPPHSLPKAPLCHELSLNATLLSIDSLAMHFLSRFDVIVVSVCGRFQIKIMEGGGVQLLSLLFQEIIRPQSN